MSTTKNPSFVFYARHVEFEQKFENESFDYFTKKLSKVKSVKPKNLPKIEVITLKRDYQPSLVRGDDGQVKLKVSCDDLSNLGVGHCMIVYTGVSIKVPENFVLLLTCDKYPIRLSPVGIDNHFDGEICFCIAKCDESIDVDYEDFSLLDVKMKLVVIDRTKMDKNIKSPEKTKYIGTPKDSKNQGRCLWKMVNYDVGNENSTIDDVIDYIVIQRQRAPLVCHCMLHPYYYAKNGKLCANAFIPKMVCDGFDLLFNVIDEIGELNGGDSHSSSYAEYRKKYKAYKKLTKKADYNSAEALELKTDIENLKVKIIMDRKLLNDIDSRMYTESIDSFTENKDDVSDIIEEVGAIGEVIKKRKLDDVDQNDEEKRLKVE